MKLKLELPQPPAKQYYDLSVLHQILCYWIANQPVIDIEYSTKLLHGLHLKSDVMEKCSHSVDIIIYNQSTVELDIQIHVTSSINGA